MVTIAQCLPMPNSGEDIQGLLRVLPVADRAAGDAARLREPLLTKPAGSLGRLEDLCAWLASWQGRYPPSVDKQAALVFAGNHGVVAQGVSAFPPAVTAQMVENYKNHGAAINQLCQTFGVSLGVHAIDLDVPTADFTQAPAMREDEFIAAFCRGMEAVDSTWDLVALGEMGIGNTTAAAALANALYGGGASQWTGPGSGVSDPIVVHKTQVVAAAVARHAEARFAPIEILRRLGGRELAAIAGAVVAARLLRVPVVLDGFVCTAAAAALEVAQPGSLDHCVVGHVSAEPGHRMLLSKLGKRPLLDLQMRLGEASGAALAIAVIRAAVACHRGMATFAEAGISGGAAS